MTNHLKVVIDCVKCVFYGTLTYSRLIYKYSTYNVIYYLSRSLPAASAVKLAALLSPPVVLKSERFPVSLVCVLS